ncbi:MAG: IS5 family transposase [Pseudomonadota bacterium]
MPHLCWLSDAQWALIEPHVPKNQPGARCVDDRRVISSIIHVLKTGCRWCNCPADYGPSTTIYNRFNRWSCRKLWANLVEALTASGAVTKSTSIDLTYVKAHRSAHGGKGGPKAHAIGLSRGGQMTNIHALTDTIGRPYAFDLAPGNVSDMKAAELLLQKAEGARYMIADKGYDADALRQELRSRGKVPVIPGMCNQKRRVVFDRGWYRERHRVENAFFDIKDFCRVATRYDKLARTFLSAVALAILVRFWI